MIQVLAKWCNGYVTIIPISIQTYFSQVINKERNPVSKVKSKISENKKGWGKGHSLDLKYLYFRLNYSNWELRKV